MQRITPALMIDYSGMTEANPFNSIYSHGYARVCPCATRGRACSPQLNAERTLKLARDADVDHAALAIFPELGLSGYSCEDLFHQDPLLDATESALGEVVQKSFTRARARRRCAAPA